jgi:hypothetical protein
MLIGRGVGARNKRCRGQKRTWVQAKSKNHSHARPADGDLFTCSQRGQFAFSDPCPSNEPPTSVTAIVPEGILLAIAGTWHPPIDIAADTALRQTPKRASILQDQEAVTRTGDRNDGTTQPSDIP